MADQDVRDFLQRMVAEEPVPFLDPEALALRARRRAARTVIVGAIGVAAAIAVLFTGVASIRSTPVPADDPRPTPTPSVDLAIFALSQAGSSTETDMASGESTPPPRRIPRRGSS